MFSASTPFRRSFLLALCIAALAAIPASAETTTFSNGLEGWEGPQGPGGASFIDAGNGNPAPSYRTQFNNFGITFSNNSNPDFIGDYTAAPSVTISTDVLTTLINFFGQDVSRDWVLELRDYDNPPGGFPWVSVWYDYADISAAQPGWRNFSVTIADTSATDLPPGWGGYGAEDPVTFEPELPADRTFTSVLAGVDEIAFTTLTPGFFFGFSDHDVSIDNLTVQFIPEPGTSLLLALPAAILLIRKR